MNRVRRRQRPKFKLNIKYRLKQIFNMKNLGIFLVLLTIVLAIAPLTVNYYISKHYKSLIYSEIGDLPETRVGIVFGAGLKDKGTKPGTVLEDRINAAVELYKRGAISKIIMSGDNREADYNEPQVMVDYAREQGVSDLDLFADSWGIRSYDTCYRAKELFGVSEAILITQEYHLPRVLYLCNTLGVDAVGYKADSQEYQYLGNYKRREVLATLLAFWQVYIDSPNVSLEGDIDL